MYIVLVHEYLLKTDAAVLALGETCVEKIADRLGDLAERRNIYTDSHGADVRKAIPKTGDPNGEGVSSIHKTLQSCKKNGTSGKK